VAIGPPPRNSGGRCWSGLQCYTNSDYSEICKKKNIKEKSFSFDDFTDSFKDVETLTALENLKLEFIHKNIIHLPNFLTKTFIQLETTDPFTVDKAFLNTIIDFDNASTDLDQEPDSVKDIINNEDLKDLQDPNDDEKSSSEHTLESSEMMQLRPKELIIKSSSQENLLHILQFCYLCVKGKITPILYSLSSNSDIENWFKSLPVPNISQTNFIISHFSYSIINNSDPNESISRPE
jgi:hypothetical protein